MKRRLLYVITLADMGGAQNHVLELVRGFKDNYDVSVAVGNGGYLVDRLTEMNVPCHVIPSIRRPVDPVSDIRAIVALRRLMKKLRPDITHAHSTKAGLLTRIAARLAGVRSVYSVHGWAFDVGVSIKQKMIVWPVEALSALFSDRLVCPTSYDCSFARRRLPISARRMSIIPYGIADKSGRADPRAKGQTPVIIMPARFSNQKDQDTLIRAASQLGARDFQLDLIGDGPNRPACEALAKELGISDRVRFLGTRTDLDDLLTQSHIFCLCSHYEGLPLSIMEAMRTGLPVVATDVSGTKEEIDHGVTGFLAPQRGVSDVAAHLRALLDDPDLRVTMGAAGRAKFEIEFLDQVMLGRLGTIYQSMIKETLA